MAENQTAVRGYVSEMREINARWRDYVPALHQALARWRSEHGLAEFGQKGWGDWLAPADIASMPCLHTERGTPGNLKSGAPRGVAQERRPSQIGRLKRLTGYGIIAPRRSNSAHLHRSRRATSEYAIASERRRSRDG
jgi:hypothetical protein